MRLLNIWSLEFHDFPLNSAPSYAIASHRWSEKETTYKDFKKSRNPLAAGHKKVEHFCGTVGLMNQKVQNSAAWQAMGFHLSCDWLWIDTACINKTDSVELSESINSMWNYYLRSAVCYAYLSDVRSIGDYHGAMLDFIHSNWFTRGWTLQELLAPRTVVFLTKDWEVVGHKCGHEKRLCDAVCRGFGQRLDFVISRITNIPAEVVTGYNRGAAKHLPVEQKLAWIQHRFTTRAEDRAYCLLGICEVFLVPIYGEGEYAWKRLQAAVTEKEVTSRRATDNRVLTLYDHYPAPPSGLSTSTESVPRTRSGAVQARILMAEANVPLRSRTDGEERRLRELRTYALPFVPVTIPEIPTPIGTPDLPDLPTTVVDPTIDVPSDWRTNRIYYGRFHAHCAGLETAESWMKVAKEARATYSFSTTEMLSSRCDYCGEQIIMAQRKAMCSYDDCATSLYHKRCTDAHLADGDQWYCWQCRESPNDRRTLRSVSKSIATVRTLQQPRIDLESCSSSTPLRTVPTAQDTSTALAPRSDICTLPCVGHEGTNAEFADNVRFKNGERPFTIAREPIHPSIRVVHDQFPPISALSMQRRLSVSSRSLVPSLRRHLTLLRRSSHACDGSGSGTATHNIGTRTDYDMTNNIGPRNDLDVD